MYSFLPQQLALSSCTHLSRPHSSDISIFQRMNALMDWRCPSEPIRISDVLCLRSSSFANHSLHRKCHLTEVSRCLVVLHQNQGKAANGSKMTSRKLTHSILERELIQQEKSQYVLMRTHLKKQVNLPRPIYRYIVPTVATSLRNKRNKRFEK